MDLTPSNWIWTPKPNEKAPLVVYCFHHAGGAAQTFRLWSDEFSELAEIRAVQLPGRADRSREACIRNLSELTKFLGEQIFSTPQNRAFAFFGHSLGALIAYDLIIHLRNENVRLPIALGVASRLAPQIKTFKESIYQLDDDAFLAALTQRYGPSPGQEYLEDPDIRAMFVPMMKADMQLFDSFEFTQGPALDIPIFAAFGSDDPSMQEVHMKAWGAHTTKKFCLENQSGGHFFWMKNPKLITDPFKSFLQSILK